MRRAAVIREVLWVAIVWAVMLTIVVAMAPGAERDAVVKIGGCSGVCVTPQGHVLTAKHCSLGSIETVRFEALGRDVQALRVYVCPEAEGPVVFDCDGDGFPFQPVATIKPEKGDAVYSMGFLSVDDPNGQPCVDCGRIHAGSRQFRQAGGTIVRGATMEFDNAPGESFNGNVVDFECGHGWSGGPLFNERGEVVGLCSNGDWRDTRFTSWQSTFEAYQAVIEVPPRVSVQPQMPTTLIIFSAEDCAPCAEVEADVRAGVYRRAGFDDVLIVKRNLNGQWSHPELWREFLQTAQPRGSVTTPTFWFRGTTQYTTYGAAGGRRGILGWIGGILRAIVGGAIDLIVGDPGGGPGAVIPVPPVEIGEPAPLPRIPEPPAEAPPEMKEAVEKANAALSTVEKLRADVQAFRDAGVIGKIALVDDLKADVAAVKEAAKDAGGAGKSLFELIKDNPLTFALSALGWLTGLGHGKLDEPTDEEVPPEELLEGI